MTSESKESQGFGCCQSGSSPDNSVVECLDCDNQGNNNTMFHTNNWNKDNNDYTFPKRESINISFKNLKYRVKSINFTKRKIETKEILHGINGDFLSGKLTAIMGPSGAGKSSLLNALAGYVASGVTGTIEINGKARSPNSQTFRALSAYIHQDDVLRPWLKVSEAMMVAAHLKLGYRVNYDYKLKVVKKILLLLGLDQRFNTYTGKLSGGQRKRLAIALELISNPPVIFLDEPTTGLDSSSCSQCISLLKKLSQDGRTVICTIHQPSALLFDMFDNLYGLSQGYCIYQGLVKELVPFLNDMGLQCPSYHNPADFLIEVASGEYGADIVKMSVSSTKKYDETSYLQLPEVSTKISCVDPNDQVLEEIGMNSDLISNRGTSTDKFTSSTISDKKIISSRTKIRNETKDAEEKNIQPASFIMQFLLLFQRNITCVWRNYFLLIARVVTHTVIGGIFGYIYTGVGPKANSVFGNYVYLYGSILLVVYTGKMSVMMSFPVEMEALTREHFNRWYNLVPYFVSILCFEIPFQVLCATSYLVISYWLTENSYEDNRFYYFIMMALLATLCAQSWGFFIGTVLPVKLAVFVGPVLAVLFSVFGFCTGYVDITPLFRWMWHISYYRAGFHGAVNSIYGMDRPPLICPDKEMYCHFKNPKIFMTEMKITNVDMEENVILMSSVIVIMHLLTVFVLWFKLNKR